jgi:general secretion pathway protein C
MSALINRLPQLSALALGLVALVSLGWQGYRFYQSQQYRASQTQSQTVSRPRKTEPRVDLAQLNLFGKASSREETAAVDTRNLPKTNLQLTLRGVMAGDGEGRTSALVQGPDQQTRSYHLGDSLPGNAKLKAVYPDRIVIDRNGHLENLFFPKPDSDEGIDVATTKPEPQPTPEDQAAQAIVNDQPDNGDGTQPGYGLSEKRKKEIQEKLRELRKRLQPGAQ